MPALTKSLIAGAAVAFIVAVVLSVAEWTFVTEPEGWSRASNNLALLAIAIAVGLKEQSKSA